MTDFVLATPNAKQVWSNKVTVEYVRESGFLPYMSSKGDGIINIQNELMGTAGNIIHVPLIAKLRGAGVRGGATLVGNEDVMANYSMAINTDVLRNAVSIKLSDSFKTEMDLIGAATSDLRGWLAETLRTDLITAFRAIPVPGTTGTNPEDSWVAYESATAAQLNSFCTANADRVLFGSAKGNATGTMSTSLATIDNTSDKVSAQMISLARKQARGTTKSSLFAIKPYKTKSGQEWYVLFLDSNAFRDAKFDPEIYAANKDARPREKDYEDNPLFTGGDLIYDGVIIKEIPELPVIAGAGAGGIAVGTGLLCGVQAVNLGYSMKAKPTRRAETDYEMYSGVGVTEIRGQAPASIQGTKVGQLTMFHASVDDA